MPLDTIKMFMGDPYVLNEHITIRQPTLREIIDYGERDYLSMVSLLTAYPSDMKSVLWDMGVDYTKVTDFEVFVAFYRFLTPDKTFILFGDLNLSALTPDTNAVGEMCLVGPDGTVIDWNIHRMIFEFLATSHMMQKQREKPGNERTKQVLIDWDREDREAAARKPYRSPFVSLISAMVNSAGFKYDHQTVQQLTIYQFYDAVQRIQLINSAQSLLSGMYSNPFMDSTKIDKKYLNWLGEFPKT